jgi:hypothetical protein
MPVLKTLNPSETKSRKKQSQIHFENTDHFKLQMIKNWINENEVHKQDKYP